MSQRTPTDNEATILASEYIQHGDKTKSFRVAFPNSKANHKSQQERASKTFDLDKVRTRIKELQKVSKKNSEEEFTMSVSKLKKTLALVIQQGLGVPDKVVDGVIHKGVSSNLSTVVSAVREFNVMDGNHAPVKSQQEIKVNDLTPWSDIEAGIDKLDD